MVNEVSYFLHSKSATIVLKDKLTTAKLNRGDKVSIIVGGSIAGVLQELPYPSPLHKCPIRFEFSEVIENSLRGILSQYPILNLVFICHCHYPLF